MLVFLLYIDGRPLWEELCQLMPIVGDPASCLRSSEMSSSDTLSAVDNPGSPVQNHIWLQQSD